ncbi:Sensory histidine kinase QseC [Labilithrix luteola]|uniref:histidine kinase n=2 Tax=Labilithrix luteola TaxID=1391654 RepID=A0A0K1PQJ3_9BACT|nr:Sensory histidine kinase QseC [Labilithrix luteola]
MGWWDVSLRESANEILRSTEIVGLTEARPNGSDLALPKPLVRNSENFEANHVSYQVWVAGREVLHSPGAPASPLKPSFADGPSRERIAGEIWWVHAVSDPERALQVQVGKPQIRWAHDMRNLWSFSAINSWLMTALLGVAFWVVIRWSLGPVTALTSAVLTRSSFDLTPLSTRGLPDEVRPLVDAFNGLLERLESALRRERRFIADAAHELRTPLAALSAMAEVALRADSMEEKDAALSKLAAVVARSTRLSEQLLDLARLDAAKGTDHYVPVDLAELVDMVVRDFETVAHEKRQTLVMNTDHCIIRGNTDELGILLRNLIDNAIRYSGEGGRIAVSCRHAPGRRQHVLLRIADNGPGVPVTERERIFHRFYRGAGNGQNGSGIGLALASGIARSHRARIQVGDGLDGRGLGVSVFFEAFAQRAPRASRWLRSEPTPHV